MANIWSLRRLPNLLRGEPKHNLCTAEDSASGLTDAIRFLTR